MSYRDFDENAPRVAWRAGLWIPLIVLFFLGIGALVWYFTVATSDVRGKGDAEKTKNSGENRIAAQARFEDLYQDITATDRKLDAAAAKVEANPDSQVAQTEYSGLVSYCIDVVGDYNAEARKYTAEQFRAADLPAVIDNDDEATDCKESSE